VAALVLLPRLRSDDADSVASNASQVAPPAAGASTTATQTGEPSEDSVEAPVKPITSGPVDPTQEQKEWALATCAIITEINGGRHDLLGGAEPSPRVAESWKEGLEQWWGVSSREDLLDTLDWIESGGHRAGFDAMAQDLSRMSPEQIADLQKQIEGDPELSSQVSVVLDDYERLGDKSLVGWDYARYVSLCGWGYLVGYLEEDEAWERIIPAAQLVQNTFDSWEDLGENYMIGREFWSYQQTQQNGAEWAACERRLHRSPDSPWVRIPWDVDLTQPGQ
jgi:hypothetical protein